MSGLISTPSLMIILTTMIPSAVLIALATILCCRAHRRKARLFTRAITPIDDEEIQSWKVDRRASEKPSENDVTQDQQSQTGGYHDHRPSTSFRSIQKPASVIIYQSPSQYNSRLSEDGPMTALTSSKENMSVGLPPNPVLARAPNSRPGLTDEAVRGEDAFIPQPKRTTMRLAKLPPSPHHGRSKSTRAITSPRHAWYGQSADLQLPPRRSADTYFPATHLASEGVKSLYAPARGSTDEDILLEGLSPCPLIDESEIGRALG